MPKEKLVKIYRYLDLLDLIYTEEQLHRAPVGMDYIRHLNSSLIPKRTFVQGELQVVEWFGSYTAPAGFDPATEAWSDLILKVEMTYSRDPAGFALHRDTLRTWYCEDDTAATPTKLRRKYYQGKDRAQEGVRRRNNITTLANSVIGHHLQMGVADPSDPVQAYGALAQGIDFYDARKSLIDAYVDVSKADLYTDIGAATDSWLDDVLRIGHDGTDPIEHPSAITIRQYVLNELNIWGL